MSDLDESLEPLLPGLYAAAVYGDRPAAIEPLADDVRFKRSKLVLLIGRLIRRYFGYDQSSNTFRCEYQRLWLEVTLRAIDDYLGGYALRQSDEDEQEVIDTARYYLHSKQVEAFGVDGEYLLRLVRAAQARLAT